MAIARQLARFVLSQEAASEEAQRFTELSLFDWATAGLAGCNEPVSEAARAMALSEGATHGSTLIGGGRAHPRAAALANGATSHALDYDDTHFLHIGHPSVVVVSAALAIAEAEGSSGADFLAALTRGLELSCRVGDWLGRSHYEAGFHQTGTAGAFGAAAAAGRLLGLDEEAMTSALGLTTTRSAGLKSQMGTMAKPLNAGFAAEVGVTCALLARYGVGSNPEAFEDAQGFGPTHAGSDRREAFDGMGREWVFPGVSYKFHACCHGLHAMLESVAEIRAAGVEPAMVERITISTNPRWLAVCNKREPQTGLEAKFSYRLTAAMAMYGFDTADLAVYSDETCRDDNLVALRDKVVVEPDGSFADTASRIIVELKNGTTRSASYDLVVAPDPARTVVRLKAKSATLLGEKASGSLWQAVSTLNHDTAGLDRLTEALQGAR